MKRQSPNLNLSEFQGVDNLHALSQGHEFGLFYSSVLRLFYSVFTAEERKRGE